MQKAQHTQDLLNVAQALGIASQGPVKFMSIEHAKIIWVEYLRASGYGVSGYDMPKKVFTKPEKVQEEK